MSYSDAMSARRRSKFSVAFTSAARVLFTTLLFAAGGMGAGLFLGIVGTVIYGMISGNKIDMANAYKHVAIPIAILHRLGRAHRIGSAGSTLPPNTNICRVCLLLIESVTGTSSPRFRLIHKNHARANGERMSLEELRRRVGLTEQ